EVGVVAVGAADHAVFLVAEARRAKPQGAVGFEQQALLRQPFDGTVDGARLQQAALREPGVELDPELGQVRTNVLDQGVQGDVEHDAVVFPAEYAPGASDQGIQPRLGVVGQRLEQRRRISVEAPAVLAVTGGGDVVDVVALVGVGRKHDLAANEFQVAQPHAGGQDVHLPPGVVDVVFTGGAISRLAQYPHQGIAIGGAAPVANVKGSGRIGRDELDEHARQPFAARFTVAWPKLPDLAQEVEPGGRCEEDVDEPGTGDLGAGDEIRCRQVFDDARGQVPRLDAGDARQRHGDIAGEIAVLLLARTLEVRHGIGANRQLTAFDQAQQRRLDQGLYLEFHA